MGEDEVSCGSVANITQPRGCQHTSCTVCQAWPRPSEAGACCHDMEQRLSPP